MSHKKSFPSKGSFLFQIRSVVAKIPSLVDFKWGEEDEEGEAPQSVLNPPAVALALLEGIPEW